MTITEIALQESLGRVVSLDDPYSLPEGRVFLSGVQALARVLLDQQRADRRAGLRTGTLVSGYQGSPLGGFDKEVARLAGIARPDDFVLRPAVNEELGATAVWGSQLVRTLPRPHVDGVVGVWYGKAPGVDRAADAIRHGNMIGTDPRGGVLALCGDDPASKSSTIPSASEPLLAALHVPVLAPGSVQELLDLGRHAIACSRASGLWCALKVVTAVADAAATAEVGVDRIAPRMPMLEWEGGPYVHRPSAHLLAPESVEMERTLVEVRLELARLYARENGLNEIHDAPGARLGVVASGTTFHAVRRALAELDPDGDAPVRLLKIAMLHPLDPEVIRRFAHGLDEVVVVEEKGPFLESGIKDALYGSSSQPLVTGTLDPAGLPLVPAHGALDTDAVVRALGRRLLARSDLPSARAALERLDAVAARPATDPRGARTPFFCSGCPHNSSTAAGDDDLVGAGIGCHTMVLLAPGGRGRTVGATQMGGEGAQWIGAAPFVDQPHFVQNLGDGTFHHSGSLAIRAAVAAGVNVTYKLLHNGTVAMTGGQDVVGELSVPALVQSLAAEGVARIVVTAEDPSRYGDITLPGGVEVRDRSALARTQRELAQVPGVTVLIHDQACAAELRRARKRGRAPDPPQRVVINERVCEGCGDCGQKSGCLSVEPVETEFGRKTRINQASCNKDFSCLEGDCPSFITVIPPKQGRPAPPPHPPVALPDPASCVPDDDVRVRLVGIGGTGVVTVNHVLGMAALIDGRHASGLDQTGLSQKAGPVVSDLWLHRDPTATGGRGLDVLLGFDPLAAASAANLADADQERTIAIVSTGCAPTAATVIDVDAPAPDVDAALAAIDSNTRAEDNVRLDARSLAQTLFASDVATNVIVLGAAWQRGAIPLSLGAIEEAFGLHGAGVEVNLAAFAWGRACVADPEAVAALDATPPPPALDRRLRALVDGVDSGDPELRRLLSVRVTDLAGWGGHRAARRYVDEVEAVRMAGGSPAETRAVAVGLHKLMAYKDEYEVARLHVEMVRELERGTSVKLHLHPPFMRALGMDRKLALGRWFVPVLGLLRRGRGLRGTPLDPFGLTGMRRLERKLPGEYLGLVHRALEARPEVALEIAELPDVVRGYEEIKLRGVERFRARAAELLDEPTEAA